MLVLRVILWLFGAVVVIGAGIFLMLDALDKVESIHKRAPWLTRLLEQRASVTALLLIVMILLIGIGYELLAKELPEETTAPSPIFPPPAAPKVEIKRTMIKTTGSGRFDRDLSEQQSDHLYRKLKEYADNRNKPKPAGVTLVSAHPCDRETQHLFFRLQKVFTDAHWVVTQELGWPMKSIQLEGQTKNRVPIGIWILSDDPYLRYLTWSSLQEAGLDSDHSFGKNEIPENFHGLIVIIGYKDIPW